MTDKNNVEIKWNTLVRMDIEGVDYGTAYYRGGYFEFEDGQHVPEENLVSSWLTVLRP